MPSPIDPIEVDPVELQDDLRDRMQRYLLTALPIHRRFPELRKQAAAELSKSASLVKGPYLEALPDFPKTKSIKELIEDGLLHKGFENLNPEVLNRPLHEHQEKAIRRIVHEKENLVVATGTGSGKTECFVYPMVDALLKASVGGKPGIRAILIYPLNALANDQLYSRIVPLLAKELRDSGISVGRYTGQTRSDWDREKFEEHYLQNPYFKELFGTSIPDNWLLAREEMRKNPPNVLVTNYAMMEHLLLLPQNAPLFDGADLKFLVLDELHTYTGAQATEVALLLRKLRNRYAPKSDVRCIGTSASLGSSEAAKQKVVEFASRLFGFPFKQVISATREAHHLLRADTATGSLKPEEWITLHEILREVRKLPDETLRRDAWNDRAMEANIDLLVEKERGSLSELLCKSLSRDESVRRVSQILSEQGLQGVSALAARVFPNATTTEQATKALTGLVATGAYARESERTFPLLPARYHLFTRGIEEATIELAHPSENGEHAKELRFQREFRVSNSERYRFRLMTCRKCGELYFEAYEKAQRIVPEKTGKGWKRSVFWLKPKDAFVIPSDSTEEQAEDRNAPRSVFIHLESGRIKDMLDESDEPSQWLETHRARMEKAEDDDLEVNPDSPARVTLCQSCGSRDRDEIITPFHPGDQALSANICEVLYSHLPTSKKVNERHKLAGRGRNLLVFSDNRQEAAFFAPYFQRTHEDLLVRRAIVKRLRNGGKARLDGLGEDLCHADYLLKGGLTDRDGNRAGRTDLAKIIRGKVFSEFCTPGGSRASLEDLGIVVVEYDMLDLQEIADKADLPPNLGSSLVRWVLDSIRLNRAISMPSEIRATDEFYWGPYAQDDRRYSLETEARFRLLPARRDDGTIFVNRYVDVLRDSLKLENWEQLLRRIWEALIDDEEEEPVLKADPEGSYLRVLDHRFLSVRLRSKSEPLFRCDKCSKISSFSVGKACTQWRCTGSVEEVRPEQWTEDLQDNHYRYLYEDLPDMPSVMAREHTAAITTELREEIESSFKQGKTNLLSSSTTMEMGIDLGDLEGVFLRNVPPDVSNYQQRAGRAGRRAQAAPVSITYSRNRRYDQDVFEHSEEFLSREPRTPFVHLGNARLFQRHQFSVLLSFFLAERGLVESGVQIGQVFGLPKFKLDGGALVPEDQSHPEFSEEAEERFVQSVIDWLSSPSAKRPLGLAKDLLQSLEPSLTAQEFEILTQTHETLQTAFVDAIRVLARTFGDRFRHYMDRAEELNQSGRQGVDSMRNRAYRWANQRVVNFVSKYGLIPTYSFPVDSIELEVIQGKGATRQDIELSRDARIGIVEYAPGAEVIANGRVWTSRAISQHPREFMPPFYYKICETCRHIEAWEDRSLIPSHCSSCDSIIQSESRVYIEPRGFTTAVEESTGKEPGTTRSYTPSAMETQLIGNAPDRLFKGSDLFRVEWALQNARDGRMVVINKGYGEGFVKCGCGYSHAVTKSQRIVRSHKRPYSEDKCEMKPSSWRFDLAHTFHTDVMQIRCHVRVPTPQLPDIGGSRPDEEGMAREQVARSACEAVRLACCKLLEIPEGEISATFRWLPQQALELILFDNVPGGAGYTAKVFELRASELLQFARDSILECPGECSRSCSKCLRSYSNQTHWESFRRHDAIAWLDSVLKVKRTDPRVELGAEEVRPQRLDELCAKSSHVMLIRDRFGDFGGGIESDEQGREVPIERLFPEWETINRWLASGKKVSVICRVFPQFRDTSLPKARRLAEVLLPHVRSGRLVLGFEAPVGDSTTVERPEAVIINEATGKVTVVYDTGGGGAVLEQRWTEGVLAREVSQKEGESLGKTNRQISAGELERPDSIQRHHYRSGDVRKLALDFEYLKTGIIYRLEIIDRYMVAAESNRDSLKKFLGIIADQWTDPPKEIILSHGPGRNQNDRLDWMRAVDAITKQLRGDPRFAGTEFRNDFRGGTRIRNFHDRRVVAHFDQGSNPTQETQGTTNRRRRKGARTAAAKRVVSAELTGGIDVLMDTREETTIFVFEEKAG